MPIDQEQAIKVLGGDAELLRSLAAIFADDAPQLADEFAKSVQQSLAGKARLAIHSLRGLTASFFDCEAVEYFARIEEASIREDWPMLTENTQMVRQRVSDLLVDMQQRQLL